MVPGIEVGSQPCGVLGIARGGVEIDDRIEGAAAANPGIQRLSFGFVLLAVIASTLVGRQRAAKHLDAMLVSTVDELPVSVDQLLGGDRLGVAAPDVIDALEQAHPSYAGLTQHVAVEPRQRAGAVAVMQERKINGVIVVDHERRPIGALNMQDLLRAGVM